MKGTEHFKDVIQNYLETRASYDELFAESFRKENKNIDECITYILTEVQRMGCAGLSDEEVYSLAVHYYDEDNIEGGQVHQLPSRGKPYYRTYRGGKSRSTEKGYRAIPSRGIPQTDRQETKSGEAGGTADSTTLIIRVLTLEQQKKNGSKGFERSTHLCRHLCQVQ